jgi:hypothetical protein
LLPIGIVAIIIAFKSRQDVLDPNSRSDAKSRAAVSKEG